jgi:N-acetylglucosamine kinase-like BadF-type ATPase
MKQPSYIMGVDVGNTKTIFALATTDGTVINTLRGPGANYQETGQAEMVTRLSNGIQRLLSGAGITLAQLQFIYYGAAGADTPQDMKILRKEFASMTPNTDFDFENDGWIALNGGTRCRPGMVITCGTANTNFAANSKGQQMRIGGLCDFLGDILGAHSIARYTMRAAMRSEDGRDHPSLLSNRVAQALNVKSNAQVINFPVDDNLVKAIIRTLFDTAQEGDGRALDICWMLTKEVLTIVREFHAGLFTRDEAFTVVLEGTVFKQQYQPLTRMIELAIQQRYPAQIVIPDYDPVLGALFLAYEKSGHRLDDKTSERFIQTYKNAERVS